MRVAIASDLHGHLPPIESCALLLIAGDICPTLGKDPIQQRVWLDNEFRRWLNELPVEQVIATWGNHDFIGELPHLVPDLPWRILHDQLYEFQGLKCYASAWTRWFGGWAFNLEEEDLTRKFKKIPDDVDILITHSPPFKVGDMAPRDFGYEHVGSPQLYEKIVEIQPKIACWGHIHESRGEYRIGKTECFNAATYGRYSPYYVEI